MKMYRDGLTPYAWPIPMVDTTLDGDLVVLLPGYTAFRAIVTTQPHPSQPARVLCQQYVEARGEYVTVATLSARQASQALRRAMKWLRLASLRVTEPDRAYPYRPSRVVARRRAT